MQRPFRAPSTVAPEPFDPPPTDGAKMCSNVAKIYRERLEPNLRRKVQLQRFPNEENIMRGVLLWLVGIPIPIIILLYLFNVV